VSEVREELEKLHELFFFFFLGTKEDKSLTIGNNTRKKFPLQLLYYVILC